MKKKLLALVLATVLVAMAIVGGTFAYLSDVQSDVNVMTMGSVYIAQHEYQRVVNADGSYKTDTIDGRTSYVLEDFVQGKPILPIVGDPNEPGNSPAYKGFDDTTVRMSQVGSYGGMDVFAGKNAVDKFVVVENTGKSSAYIRTIVAVEIGEGDATLIGSSFHSTWTKNSIGTVEIDGNKYFVTEYIYAGAQLSDGSWRHEGGVLPAGDTAYPSLSQVYLKSKATNKDVEAIDGNNNGTLDILVVTQAVQAAGFENAAQALDAAFGDVTVNNNPWVSADANKLPSIVMVKDTEELQAALDNAVAGTTIQLTPGMTYGVVYLRPSANTSVTKAIDWVANNYRYETYSCFEDLTIIGAYGATVDAIEIEGGIYYNTEHSQSATYPIMLSLIELKNVVIDGVTFTGNGGYDPQGHGNVINLSGNNIKVDGLTIKDCVLNNEDNNARLIYKTESTTSVHNYTVDGVAKTFVPSLKDITVTGCTLNGGYMGLELRETENVTITNNTFNVADRNILLPVNTGCTYSGNVTITGNVSNYAKERFVRADGMGDAVVVIANNIINSYMGADEDYIKVTNANNLTIDGNPWTADAANDLVALEKGEDVILTNNLTFSASETTANSGYGATGVEVNGGTFDGNGNTLTVKNAWNTWDCAVNTTGGTIKNLVINSAMRGIFMGSATADVYIDNVIIDGTVYTFNSDGGNKNYGVYISNSTLNGWTSHSDVHKEVVYTNCEFGEGSGYAFCRPYGPTAFVGCDFEAGFEVDAIGKVTFENCTIGGVALTADNLATLVTSNTANATVK